MFKFLKNYFLFLIMTLFISFYFSYVITVGYQIFLVHKTMLAGQNFKEIQFGIITFVIMAFLPLMLWKMAVNSEVPILKETLGIRFVLSLMASAFTAGLFISKIIFNNIAQPILKFENGFLLGTQGRYALIEILSLAVPLVISLYLTKKFISFFTNKPKEW